MGNKDETKARAAAIMQERNQQVYLPVFRDEIWKCYSSKLDRDRILFAKRWSRAPKIFPTEADGFPFKSKKFPLRDFHKDKIAIKFQETSAQEFMQDKQNPRLVDLFVSNPPLVSHYKHAASEQRAQQEKRNKFCYPETTSGQVGWLSAAARRYAYKGEKSFAMRNLNQVLGQPSDFHCYTF